MKKLIYGAGLNDADYAVQPRVNGKQVICPFYVAWVAMIKRCHDAKYQAKRPTYIGCNVCTEWLAFSNFRLWMTRQDWQGNELDKDLLLPGNKTYSPQTCVFVDAMTNNFTTDRGADRGEWPIGVNLHKPTGKFKTQCRNPFTKKQENLGYFTSPEQAHTAWRNRKHELACQLADMQSDTRVAQALRIRYLTTAQ